MAALASIGSGSSARICAILWRVQPLTGRTELNRRQKCTAHLPTSCWSPACVAPWARAVPLVLAARTHRLSKAVLA